MYEYFFKNECLLKNVCVSQVRDVCVQTREMVVITMAHAEVQSCVQTVDTEVQSCVQTVDTEAQTYLSFSSCEVGRR